ncbi:MAG: GGDEF domain-containing protein [Leptospiraceae bacterium]|nr:GGDEF domain-containing protein [Leptospiraceae bacterium]MCP5513659.1 GGDEF domain-containing protein [Leptospiraceae bacterium]
MNVITRRKNKSNFNLKSIFLFFFAFFHLQIGAVELPTLTLKPEAVSFENFPIWHFEDTRGDLEITSLEKESLHSEIQNSRFYIPVHSSIHWFGLQLKNESDSHLDIILYLDESFMESLDLYESIDGQWKVSRNGLSVPISDRTLKNRNPSFPIHLKPGESRRLFLRLDSKFQLLTAGIVIDSIEGFHRSEQILTGVYWFYFGCAFIIITYNFFLYISLKERLYLYYVIHAFFYMVFVAVYSGFEIYLIPNSQTHYLLNVSISIAAMVFVKFTRVLLDTKSNLPTIDKILKIYFWIFLISSFIIVVEIKLYHYLIMIGVPMMFSIFIMGIVATANKIKLSFFYLSGVSWYIFGIVMIGGVNAGFFPYNMITRYSFLLGSIFEFMVFSLAIANRIKTLQQDRLSYHNLLLNSEKKAKKMLQAKVEERTTELNAANIQLIKMSYLDWLTGLYNRRYLDRKLPVLWEQTSGPDSIISLIMCDIDYFKMYNDTYGHPAGDQVIETCAEAIKSSITHKNSIGVRYGGEEFLILLPNMNEKETYSLAEEIRIKIMNLQIPHSGSPLNFLTMSFGLATVNPRDTESSELIKLADSSLYKSKTGGRNQVSIHSEKPQIN